MRDTFCTLPNDPCTVREVVNRSITAFCLTVDGADRIVTALNRESNDDALTHALIAALKALHAADVDGSVLMADLRSIAIQRCREVVERIDAQATRDLGNL